MDDRAGRSHARKGQSMFSWSRQSCALALAAVFIVGGASPVFAFDAVEQNPASSINLAMAPGVPLADVSAPATPTDAQTRPIDLAVHHDDIGGFAAPAVRRSM